MRDFTVVAVDEWQTGHVFHLRAASTKDAVAQAREEHSAHRDYRADAQLTIAAVFEGNVSPSVQPWA